MVIQLSPVHHRSTVSTMRVLLTSLAVAFQFFGNMVHADDTATRASTGKLTIDRAWAEDVGGYLLLRACHVGKHNH